MAIFDLSNSLAGRPALLSLCLFLIFGTCASAAPMSVPLGSVAVPPGQIARYQQLYPNPQITAAMCQFEALGDANAVAIHNVQAPPSDKHLFWELPYAQHPLVNDGAPGIVVDARNPKVWAKMKTNESVFCSGHTFTSDGLIMVAGGHSERVIAAGAVTLNYTEGLDGVRLIDPLVLPELTRVNTLSAKRWYPTAKLLPDSTILIAGGTTLASNNGDGVSTVEIFDPMNPYGPMKTIEMPAAYLAAFDGKPWYPLAWPLPTGHILMFADNNTCILNHHTGKCVVEADPNNPGQQRLVSQPPRPRGCYSTYPFTASGVMLTLRPDAKNQVNQAEFVIFGGSRKDDHPMFREFWKEGYNPEATACRWSHRITLSWQRTGPTAPWTFTFGPWVEEDMGYPRVMPDATLLPNGDVVILNGAQAGVAGYPVISMQTNASMALAQYPAFWASLYQPDRPANNRYTLLCGTEQPRVYHATAALNTEGKIVVAGADRNRLFYDSGVPWFNGSTNAVRPAYNLEMFHPPYVYDIANKPEIVLIEGEQAGGVPVFDYNTQFNLTFNAAAVTGSVNVTSVVLVAPSSTTHSCNFNQRVVELVFNQIAPGRLRVTTPLHPFNAPPQYYMLFINNVKTYSTAKWVKLVDRKRIGSVIPLP